MPRRSPRPTSTVGSDENSHQLHSDVEGRPARPSRGSPQVTPQWSWATEFHLVLKQDTIKQHKFLTLMVCANQDTRRLPCLPFSAAAIQTIQRDYILVDVRLSLQIRSSPPTSGQLHGEQTDRCHQLRTVSGAQTFLGRNPVYILV